MRIRIRNSLAVALVLVGAPAALFLFSQLRGNISPIRAVQDPYPVFADIAVDPDSNLVAVADENKFSLRTYDRQPITGDVADPRTVITGTKSGIDFVCGVALDPINKQLYTANNDTARNKCRVTSVFLNLMKSNPFLSLYFKVSCLPLQRGRTSNRSSGLSLVSYNAKSHQPLHVGRAQSDFSG